MSSLIFSAFFNSGESASSFNSIDIYKDSRYSPNGPIAWEAFLSFYRSQSPD